MQAETLARTMMPLVPKVIHSKCFNKNSRELFSELCPVTECEQGKPTNEYVLQKVNSAYQNLVLRWEEFKPFIEAINEGKAVWQRNFSINKHEYKTVTLDDMLVAHEFVNKNNTKQGVCFLPPGYAGILTQEDGAEIRFDEVYKALGYGDEFLPILDADIKDREKHFEEFGQKFDAAPALSITREFYSDMCALLAQTLQPFHAAARNKKAFEQMLDVIGEERPEVYNFLIQNYGSAEGLSKIIEHEANKQLAIGVQREDAKDNEGISLPTKLASIIFPSLIALAGWAGAAAGEGPDAHKDSGAHSRASDSDWSEKNMAVHPPARYGQAMAGVYGDSKVVLFGGFGNKTFFSDTWVYDAGKGVWENKTPALSPSARTAAAMAGVFGTSKVVLFGGVDGYTGLSDTWVYDVKTNTWTNLSPQESPAGRTTEIASISGDDKIVLFGGSDYDKTYGDTWVYDLSDNKWIPAASGPSERTAQAMANIDSTDKVVMFGGFYYGARLADTWVYSQNTNQWEQKNISSPSARDGHSMATMFGDDKVVMFGGQGYDPASGTWVYSLSDNKWSEKSTASSPVVRSSLTMAGIYGTKDVLMFGGTNHQNTPSGDNVYGDTWVYGAAGVQPPPDSQLIVQLSDTHIGAQGADVEMQKMVDKILHFGTKPKYVVVTGDIVDFGYGDDGAVNYHRFVELIQPLENAGIKVYTVPGNHDWRASDDKVGSQAYVGGLDDILNTRLQNYRTIMGDRDISGKAIDDGNYVIIGLDSGHDIFLDPNYPIIAPRGSGLKDVQVSWLDNTLDNLDGKLDGKDASGKEKIIIMHHQGYNQVLLGQAGVINNNQDQFLKINKNYDVNVVLGGHTHKNSVQTKDSTRYVQTASATYDLTWRNVSIMNFNGQWRVVVSNPQIIQKTVTARTGCPVDVAAYDSSGNKIEPRVKSVFAVDDKGSKQTELSVYYEPNLRFRVVGTADAGSNSSYSIEIRQNSETNETPAMAGEKIPIEKGAVHDYEWTPKDSVTVRIDDNGDGKFERTINANSNLTANDFKKNVVKPKNNILLYEGTGTGIGIGAAAAAGSYLFYRRRKGEGNASLAYNVAPSNSNNAK